MSAPDHGFEDVRYIPIEQATNVYPVMPGGRSPGLLADSIQPVLVLGDGRGAASASNEITQSSFQTGALVFGSTTLGGPYYEFHAPKAQASALARAIVGGLAEFLDYFIPVPVFSQTAGGGGALEERPDRAVIVYDVTISQQVGGASGPGLAAMAVGFGSSTFKPFRAMNNQTITTQANEGEQGDEPLANAAVFFAGQLFDNLPHSKNPTPGNHVIFHRDAQTFWFGSGAEGPPPVRPFAHLVPFWMPEESFFYIGQTDFMIGVNHGTPSQFAVNVIWREVPI